MRVSTAPGANFRVWVTKMTYRTCTQCGNFKFKSEFRKEPRVKSGLSASCRKCQSEYQKSRTASGYLKSLYSDPVKRLRRNELSRNWKRENKDTLRELDAKRQRLKRENCREEVRVYGRVASSLRRSRVAEAEGSFTKNDIDNIYRLQNGKCAYFKSCHNSLDNGYQIDHIVPLSKGGTNWPRNLQLTCQPCNGSKNAKDPIEFSRELGNLL